MVDLLAGLEACPKAVPKAGQVAVPKPGPKAVPKAKPVGGWKVGPWAT